MNETIGRALKRRNLIDITDRAAGANRSTSSRLFVRSTIRHLGYRVAQAARLANLETDPHFTFH
jgi:hypothetical protein